MQGREQDAGGWCDELPEFEPHGGWSQVQRRRTRVVWVRRSRTLAGVLMLAALPLAYWLQRPEPAVVQVTMQAASDSELLAARTPELAHNEGVRVLEAQLARVDRELQSCYDVQASASELDLLWRTRHELENALLVAYRRPEELVSL
jgi:hypothetical protein